MQKVKAVALSQHELFVGIVGIVIGLFFGLMMANFSGQMGQGSIVNPLRVSTFEDRCREAGGTPYSAGGKVTCLNGMGSTVLPAIRSDGQLW